MVSESDPLLSEYFPLLFLCFFFFFLFFSLFFFFFLGGTWPSSSASSAELTCLPTLKITEWTQPHVLQEMTFKLLLTTASSKKFSSEDQKERIHSIHQIDKHFQAEWRDTDAQISTLGAGSNIKKCNGLQILFGQQNICPLTPPDTITDGPFWTLNWWQSGWSLSSLWWRTWPSCCDETMLTTAAPFHPVLDMMHQIQKNCIKRYKKTTKVKH